MNDVKTFLVIGAISLFLIMPDLIGPVALCAFVVFCFLRIINKLRNNNAA